MDTTQRTGDHIMNTLTYPLTGLHCGACVRRVTDALKPHADHVEVTLDPMQATLTGVHADAQTLRAAVRAAGKYELELPQLHEQKQALAHIESASPAIKNIANDVPVEVSPSWLATYRPLLLLIGYILAGSLLIQLGMHAGHDMTVHESITLHETMRYFMAGFFLTFSFFKLLDLKAFADAYAGYDLLAARWHGWGLVYPFVELALGVAYLINWNPVLTNWTTLIVMGFSAIGVIRAVMNQQQIRCACLGAVFNLPMSTVTIVEDVGMVLMAVWMLS
jgi:copper chaperone CopZ